jgi:hypothetical protein
MPVGEDITSHPFGPARVGRRYGLTISLLMYFYVLP